MTDGDRLMEAILDDPADDLARLAYADWLEDHGDGERAALIRDGLARPGMAYTCASPAGSQRWDEWRVDPATGECLEDGPAAIVWPRQQPLHRRLELAAGALGRGGVITVRRGMVEEVALSCKDFMARAGEIFRAHPVIRVLLADREPTAWNEGEWLLERRRRGRPAESFTVPAPVADRFRPRLPAGPPRSFPSRDAAITALSAACVAYGRSLRRPRGDRLASTLE